MQLKVSQEVPQRERRMLRMIDKANWTGQLPIFARPPIDYELADRVQATSAGGMGVVLTRKRLFSRITWHRETSVPSARRSPSPEPFYDCRFPAPVRHADVASI